MSLFTKDEIEAIELLGETDNSLKLPLLKFTENEFILKDSISVVKVINNSFNTILEILESYGENIPNIFVNAIMKVSEKMLSLLNSYQITNEQEKIIVNNTKNAAKAILWEVEQRQKLKSRQNWDLVIGEKSYESLFAESQQRIHLLGED